MEELDLSQLFSLFWRRKVQIILIVLIFVIIGITYTTAFVTPVYTSSTTLVLATDKSSEDSSSSGITTTDVTLSSKLISTYKELATSDKVARKIISNLGLTNISEDSLRNSISVKVVSDSELIKISVTNQDSEVAAKIANEVAVQFIEEVKEYYGKDNVHVVDEAEAESTPSNINHTKDVIIFAFIGVVVAVIYALLDNMLDTTVRTTDDIEKTCSVTVLASIPFDNSTEGRRGGKK